MGLRDTLSGSELSELAFWCLRDGTCAAPQDVARIVDAGADRVGLAICSPPFDDAITPLIDHTLLKPEATENQVRQLCGEAVEYGFASVCVNPWFVPLIAGLLAGSPVRACTVIGFPLGANHSKIKGQEAHLAASQGATELDMVINVGALKSGLYDLVRDDIRGVVEGGADQALVKVILETALLTPDEIERACELARDAGAAFVKTSTGFGPGGATADDVALMRRTVGRSMGVKASGGIGTREDAAAMIAAGATRIGASAGVRIAGGA
ncbi:MAG: deoxyribose-phosphate aldolase [Acidobacteria bacterium]|nr:deoxyribose-phosphate aldolase [Acidobacteriota bacterium]